MARWRCGLRRRDRRQKLRGEIGAGEHEDVGLGRRLQPRDFLHRIAGHQLGVLPVGGFERAGEHVFAFGVCLVGGEAGFDVRPVARHELIGNPDIEAIVIATPVHTHYELALKALQKDKHVLL